MPEKTSIAEVIADRFTLHNLNLLRFEAGERRTIRRMLQSLEKDILKKMDKLIPIEGVEKTFQKRRLNALHEAIEKTLAKNYRAIHQQHQESRMEFAQAESLAIQRNVNRAINVSLLNVGVPETTLRALVQDEIVGKPALEWWSNQAGTTLARFKTTIRQGVFAGETLGQLLRRVRGTRERRFKDGIMEASTRNAEALIRTSIQSIANAARWETLKANGDVIKGVQALVTFDARTSDICIARSGFAWDLEGNPLNKQTTENFPGPPPWHFNCRSTLIPVLRTWDEMIKDPKLKAKTKKVLQNVPKSTRSSMDGQVADDLSFNDWLKGKPESIQKEILGPGKWGLWKKGKIGLTDLIDQTGRPLTLGEIKNKIQA